MASVGYKFMFTHTVRIDIIMPSFLLQKSPQHLGVDLCSNHVIICALSFKESKVSATATTTFTPNYCVSNFYQNVTARVAVLHSNNLIVDTRQEKVIVLSDSDDNCDQNCCDGEDCSGNVLVISSSDCDSSPGLQDNEVLITTKSPAEAKQLKQSII